MELFFLKKGERGWGKLRPIFTIRGQKTVWLVGAMQKSRSARGNKSVSEDTLPLFFWLFFLQFSS